jgi:hypothetical protein
MTQALHICRLRPTDSVNPVRAAYPAAPSGTARPHAQIASFWCADTAACDAAVDAGSKRAGDGNSLQRTKIGGPGVPIGRCRRRSPVGSPYIHPDDLQALRLRVLALLRDEAKRGDGTIRSRLFGQGKPLEDIEHLTDAGLYAALASKLYLAGREYTEVEAIAAIPDKGDQVQVLIRGRQPRDRGTAQVVNVVTLRPHGKDWKAVLPNERAVPDSLARQQELRPVVRHHYAVGCDGFHANAALQGVSLVQLAHVDECKAVLRLGGVHVQIEP